MSKQEWVEALTKFIKAKEQQSRIPRRECLTLEQEWQCQLIGGSFISWFESDLRAILAERSALRVAKLDPEPVVVFTSSVPGLIAVSEIMPEPQAFFFALLHSEFVTFCEQHPVEVFKFHVHHWSYFDNASGELLSAARDAHPEVDQSDIRVHEVGTAWGERSGSFQTHLWHWDGKDMTLLKESIKGGVY